MNPNEEQELFERTMRVLQWTDQQLRRHQHDITWFGNRESIPMYVDPHTNAVWTGWKLRSRLV